MRTGETLHNKEEVFSSWSHKVGLKSLLCGWTPWVWQDGPMGCFNILPEVGVPYSSISALHCLGYVRDDESDMAFENLNRSFCEILQVLFPLPF